MAHNHAHAPLVGPAAPTTYVELYNAMPDTLNGVYMAYLEDFDPESAAQPATLRDRIMTMANDVPKVFAVMQDTPAPRIVFVHRPTRFAPSWNRTQAWDDVIFGFQGDVQPGNQINMIEWPVTPFGRTALPSRRSPC